MKTRTLICGFVLGAASALIGTQALSQDHDGGGSGAGGGKGASGGGMPGPQEMQQMMEQMMKTMKPGEHHKLLQSSVGTWDVTTKIWMDPAAPPSLTKGTSECKWVLDGRFVMEDFKSEFPMGAMTGGQVKNIPWYGMGLFGYDNFRNMYVGCWADTMGTQLLTMKGTASPDGKTFTYYGEMDEPELSMIGRTVKYQTKYIDNDTHVFTIYDLAAGDNYKVVEVTYTRKK